jgi:beta-lactam-binding protein with PASTA domain
VGDRNDIPYFGGSRRRGSKPSDPEVASESVAESPGLEVASESGADLTPTSAVASETSTEPEGGLGDIPVSQAAEPEGGLGEIPVSQAAEPDGGLGDMPVTDDAELAAPGSPQRSRRTGLTIAAGVASLVVLFFAVWLAAVALHKVTTPFIVARTPDAAERILLANQLAAGNARLVATGQFAPGRIMEQSPQTPTALKPGSRVNVVVATATANVPVPDVLLADQSTAEKLLSSSLFVPTVIYAYTSDAAIGDIVSQLPRAGDMAFTGSPVFIVSSLGPGSPGIVVPALIGKSRKVAESLLATDSLSPRTLTVDAPTVARDTVVDQTPAPGMTVQVGTSVAISLTPAAP